MRKDEVSISFGVRVSAVLQQFCSLFTAVSLFSPPGKGMFTGEHGSSGPLKHTEMLPNLSEDERRD